MTTARRSAFRGAKATRKIDNQTDQQDKTQPTAAEDRTPNVKTAAAEQKQQHHQQ
jgi:hypothetical protein